MSSNTTKPQDPILDDAILKSPPQSGPILEPWRILALALIVAAGMLFVHLVVPADAAADAIGSAPISSQTGRP